MVRIYSQPAAEFITEYIQNAFIIITKLYVVITYIS